MNSIIINGNNFYVDKSNQQLIVFIECQFTTKIYFKLLELSKEVELHIFVRNTNKYTRQDLKIERDEIIANHTKASVDNYYRYQLEGINYEVKQATSSIPTSRPQLEELVNSTDLLAQPIDKNFVIEYKLACNNVLKEYLELLFRNINADKIAFTSDLTKINKISNQLNDSDRLIAVSSNNVDDQIFYIAENLRYVSCPKLIIIGQADYKYAVSNLLANDFIIDYNDSLRYSKYFNQLCDEYQVQTTNHYMNNITLINDSITITAIIDIVQNSGAIEIYHMVNQEHKLLAEFTSEDFIFEQLKFEYNHCVKTNIKWTIEQSILNSL